MLSTLAPNAPEICGDFDLRILRDGTWLYRGAPIGRAPLVKLFASVLRREADGGYWLVTPVERGRVTVDDVPFVAIDVDFADGEVRFRTNLDEMVAAGPENPLRMVPQPDGAAVPYIRVRDGLDARVARAAFYRLIDGAEIRDGQMGVASRGVFFPLGPAA